MFLTSAGEVKLGDFGHCRRLDADGFAHTTCGTPETMSPEMVLGCPYDVKADTWAVGCVLYELMMLRRPFDGLTVHELLAKVCRAAYDPPPEDMNNDIRLLISVMLTADPRNRPTMSELEAFPAVKKAKEAHRKSQMAPRQKTLTDVMAHQGSKATTANSKLSSPRDPDMARKPDPMAHLRDAKAKLSTFTAGERRQESPRTPLRLQPISLPLVSNLAPPVPAGSPPTGESDGPAPAS